MRLEAQGHFWRFTGLVVDPASEFSRWQQERVAVLTEVASPPRQHQQVGLTMMDASTKARRREVTVGTDMPTTPSVQ
jgi:hypothetical protein